MTTKLHPRLAVVAAALLTGVAVACGSSDGSGVAVTPPTAPPPPTAAPTATPEPITAATPQVSPVDLGKSLAARNGCATCHTIDGSPRVGPTWKGLYLRDITLDDGSTAVADEAYITRSIREPNAQIVKGFVAGVMPRDFGTRLDDEQIGAIIEYIKSLR